MNSIKENNILFYNEYYLNKQRSFEEYMLAYNMFKVINRRHCFKNILEIGYGSCILAKMLIAQCECNYYGYELSSSAKKIFNTIPNVTDINNINSSDIKYDLIILSNVIEHIEKDFNFIHILYDSLNINGRICMSFPTNNYFDDDPRHFRTYDLIKFSHDISLYFKDIELKTRYLPPTSILILIRFTFINTGKFLIYFLNLLDFHNKKSTFEIGSTITNSQTIKTLYFKFLVPIMKLILKFDFLISRFFRTSQGYIEIIKTVK